MHRHHPTFCDDVEKFRPERWIEALPEPNVLIHLDWCMSVTLEIRAVTPHSTTDKCCRSLMWWVLLAYIY